jgi:catechol 2,3-dioxygenase-like lactoylglutathione lyase family enzyme
MRHRASQAILTAGLAAILAGMDVTGLGWCGTRTEHDEQLANFYEHVLGLRPVHAEPGLRIFELPDGRNVEVFGPLYRGREHFDSGPVVGFAVRDLPAAAEELRNAGIELLGEPGPTWQHFRGPDGNVYELVAS